MFARHCPVLLRQRLAQSHALREMSPGLGAACGVNMEMPFMVVMQHALARQAMETRPKVPPCRKPDPPLEADDPEQSRRFIDMAREVETDQTLAACRT
jgi:hypothetical protein